MNFNFSDFEFIEKQLNPPLNQKNMTTQEVENLINSKAKTNVTMRGDVDASGLYSGFIEGPSKAEISAFLNYIANRNDVYFDTFIMPHLEHQPPMYISKVSFSCAGWDNSKTGFFKKLFG